MGTYSFLHANILESLHTAMELVKCHSVFAFVLKFQKPEKNRENID